MNVGIEAIGIYAGAACVDVKRLAQVRELDATRFDNLLMRRKTVSLPFEDPVSFGVNAARPLVDALTPDERRRIELLIVCTESGIDFGKSMSTYVHHHLGLARQCRSFEIKHACYAGTAGLQTAAAFVRASGSAEAKALVISTDAARPIPHTYAEPSQGAAAVALLVSATPHVLELEPGASGYYGYEVMDSCRPTADIETGDADLSLLSYLDCLENSFRDYQSRVGPVDFERHFAYLAFHTPFGGLAKGAHRMMMRKLLRKPPPAIEEDFQRRVAASLALCQETGNAYSSSVFLALCGLLEHGTFDGPTRIGLFSYGSGCCSEFYSGIATERSQHAVRQARFPAHLADRHELDIAEYDGLLALNRTLAPGAANLRIDRSAVSHIYESRFAGRGLLVLDGVAGYHREYSRS